MQMKFGLFSFFIFFLLLFSIEAEASLTKKKHCFRILSTKQTLNSFFCSVVCSCLNLVFTVKRKGTYYYFNFDAHLSDS